MSILLFEDDQVTDLYPISISRPAYTISCGGYRLIDLLAQWDRPIRWLVRPHLREIQEADFGHLGRRSGGSDGPCLIVNAALVPSIPAVKRLRQLLEAGNSGVARSADGRLAAAVARSDCAALHATTGAELLAALQSEGLPLADGELPLFQYPHDVIRHHLAIVRESLEHRVSAGGYRQTDDGVFLRQGAELGPYVVTDTRTGPIVIDEHAQIGPYTCLRGPVYIGPRSRVIEHAAIKDGTCLAHTTKIGGEVEASIVEAYTNKQHHGFIGHSYLASWINLGAGTCNSDLKNTYGLVNMEYHGRKVATGMQFVGAIIADYAKTAINTGIFTGKTIGTCSMVYGFVTTNVPSFVNYARLFGQVTETPVEVMIATQGRMFARRNVAQRPCDIQLLRDMYEITRPERQIGGDPLSL
jgi:UDP-N-acetylglucosamine diphosphorylase/glucosamine-1-phosphate N-acetyltransferase